MDIDNGILSPNSSFSARDTVSSNQEAIQPLDQKKNVSARRASTPPGDSFSAFLDDPILFNEYSDEIFAYMREMEENTTPNPHYIAHQPHITWEMRRILVDWMTFIHQKLGLLPETLFLAVNLMDRFMSQKANIPMEKFQLVGIAAMFTASKYEEIQVPSVREYVKAVDFGYSASEIVNAERVMLSVLKFGIGYNGPCSLAKRVLGASTEKLDPRFALLVQYFLEMALMDNLFLGVAPSLMVASAMFLAKMVLNNGSWTAEHTHLSGYAEAQVIACAKAMYASVAEVTGEAAVFMKHSDEAHSFVAKFVKEFTAVNVVSS
ncbi:hypothetical protein HDU84_006924 [Entophlyctis sp. JEL0112]|nr:hypothetical protein HDU84_006924 [Entophlyctis sp. JEL0112]